MTVKILKEGTNEEIRTFENVIALDVVPHKTSVALWIEQEHEVTLEGVEFGESYFKVV